MNIRLLLYNKYMKKKIKLIPVLGIITDFFIFNKIFYLILYN